MDKLQQIWAKLVVAYVEKNYEDIEIGCSLLAHEAKCLRLEQEQKEGAVKL